MESIILLNADYVPINTIHWKKAIKLIIKDVVEPIGSACFKIKTASSELVLPKILRLTYLVKQMYKNKVPYSKKNVLVRDNFTCMYCGSKKGTTIDHIIPTSKGGKSIFENTVACCLTCNTKKEDKLLSDTNMKLIKIPHHPIISDFIRLRMEKSGAFDLVKNIFNI